MDDIKKAGESTGTTATGQESKSENRPETEARIADLEARLARETKDKEIYRSGLLAAKDLGKTAKRITTDDLEDPDKLEKAIEAKIQDKEIERKASDESERKIAEEERLRKENDELRRSLEAAQSSGSSGSAGMGSGHNERSESKPVGYWSSEQKELLRSMYAQRGFYTPAIIEKMVVDAEQIAMGGTPFKERKNTLAPKRNR